jgi:endo-1,4-beta-xylanase
VNRRQALQRAIGLAACAALPQSVWSLQPQLSANSFAPLKTAGSCPSRRIGVATPKASLENPTIAEIVTRNFNLLTASGMKWVPIHPEPDKYDFTEADWNVRFARQHHMEVHGHNLCWNSPANYPPWFKTELNRSNARKVLAEHITTVVKRYAGQVSSWDVVNEPVVPWSKRPDGLYPGVWTDYIGPEYFDIAFQATAEADPDALRMLNIYDVEQGTEPDEENRKKTLQLLKQLVDRHVPIQAVGFESHLDDSLPLGGESYRNFLDDIRSLGLPLMITELDVQEDRSAPSQDWDQNTAKYYGDYLTDFISAVNPPFIIFWSLQDRWQGGKRVQGLLQDNLTPRLNYHASIDALQRPAACS